jgi:hypothetical protein
MARRTKLLSTDVDVQDLISIICNYRKEAFPFERFLALLTFASWLHWPSEPEIVNQARTVAAGLIVRAIQKGVFKGSHEQRRGHIAEITKAVMQPEAVADALVNRKLVGSYRDNFESHYKALHEVSMLVRFFLICPRELKPSLNKALAFFDGGNSHMRASLSTLKKSWGDYALIGAFILAEDWLEFSPIVELAPDDEDSIAGSRKILGDVDGLRKYFGVARYLQDRLEERLDPITLRRFEYGDFPDCIEACSIEIPTMEPSQVEAVQKYKAPRPS